MQTFPPLESMGQRICVCGPSNAGKSTLTAALSRKLEIPAVHLDQLYHLPGTNWVPRQPDEFEGLHEKAILGESWIMDGNYSRLFPQRMARATSIILLGTGRWSAFARYLRRTLFEKDRAGHLDSAQDSIKWMMIRYILFVQPKRRGETISQLESFHLPLIRLNSMGELKELYAAWELPYRHRP